MDHASDREPHKYSRIPQGMGNDNSRKALREKTVDSPPDDSGDKSCHHEHEVAGRGMDKGIDERRHDESCVSSPLD